MDKNASKSNSKGNILWIDDEIELLRPHIILLEQRGYSVDIASNGEDAIELVKGKHFDLIFLDESMVGISGLETLPRLKEIDSATPVVMVTKNEAEDLMEQAIGSNINDYLTKPVNPTQILLTCKKFLESSRIAEEKFTQEYLQGFNTISRKLMERLEWSDWVDIYKDLVQYSMDFDRLSETGLKETLQDQWRDCNAEFSKFVEKNYKNWVNLKKLFWKIVLLWFWFCNFYIYCRQYVYGFRFTSNSWISITNYVLRWIIDACYHDRFKYCNEY